MVTILLEKILTLLTGWLEAFTTHAGNVLAKLNLIEEDTSNLSDIKDNTAETASNTVSIITPINNISGNTSSIKTNTDSIKADTTIIKNNINTISTNTGSTSAFCEDIANNTLDCSNRLVTIGSDTTQLRSNSNTVLSDLDKVYEALKWALVDKVTTETVEGNNSISFDTDLTNDLVKLEVGVEGEQSGTGDPSPSNVRPIIGVTDKSVTVNGNNITIALGQTIFGGVLDVITGVLTITEYLTNITATQSKYENTNGYFWYTTISTLGIPSWNAERPAISNRLIRTSTVGVTTSEGYFAISNDIIRWKENGTLSKNDYDNYLSSNPIQLAYSLLTPIEVQLTPSQIATINGINTISTDGTIKVTYEETVKHYLDKQ